MSLYAYQDYLRIMRQNPDVDFTAFLFCLMSTAGENELRKISRYWPAQAAEFHRREDNAPVPRETVLGSPFYGGGPRRRLTPVPVSRETVPRVGHVSRETGLRVCETES